MFLNKQKHFEVYPKRLDVSLKTSLCFEKHLILNVKMHIFEKYEVVKLLTSGFLALLEILNGKCLFLVLLPDFSFVSSAKTWFWVHFVCRLTGKFYPFFCLF